MIDMHNHVLFGVDDGAFTIQESIEMILTAYRNGTKKMILTPHYYRDRNYLSTVSENTQKLNMLRNELEKRGCQMELFLGNELFIESDLDVLLETGKVLPLADSRYVLVEFPMDEYKGEYDEYLYNLTVSGYKVIIAHPERYAFVQEKPAFCETWVENGYYLQSNADSLKYRNKKKVIDYLLKRGWLSFMASDAHNKYRNAVLSNAFIQIEKDYSFEIARMLFEDNPDAIINNSPISTMPLAKRHLHLF